MILKGYHKYVQIFKEKIHDKSGEYYKIFLKDQMELLERENARNYILRITKWAKQHIGYRKQKKYEDTAG